MVFPPMSQINAKTRTQAQDNALASISIPTPPARLLYPKAEAAILLGISPRGIDYLISAGRLKTVRIGKRNLIPAEELRRFARGDRPEAIRPSSAPDKRIA
jgi:excisionase family DNA binding protein